jgi:signal transduction histidine kinase
MSDFSKLRHYGVAVIASGVALLIARPLNAPVSSFLFAILVSSIFGGRGPGLLAIGISTIAFCRFYLPFPLSPSNAHYSFLRLGFFIAEALATNQLVEIKRRNERRILEVQEAERRHLASELHDEIGQLLTGLRLQLKFNEAASFDEIKNRFDQARSIVDDLLATVRRLSFDLRPADLDQFGLLPALLGLLERYTVQTGILVDFKHWGMDRRFGTKVETAAYRVVQEALTNIARHASVAGVTVRLWTEVKTLNLQVDDRGRGFDPEIVLKVARSSGLLGMSERISLVGGRMTIDSTPGKGTTITAELPLNDSSAL